MNNRFLKQQTRKNPRFHSLLRQNRLLGQIIRYLLENYSLSTLIFNMLLKTVLGFVATAAAAQLTAIDHIKALVTRGSSTLEVPL